MQTPLFVATSPFITPNTPVSFEYKTYDVNSDSYTKNTLVGTISNKSANTLVPSIVDITAITNVGEVVYVTNEDIVQIAGKDPMVYAKSKGIKVEKYMNPEEVPEELLTDQKTGRPSTIPSLGSIFNKLRKERNGD